MSKVERFENLRIWQMAHDLTIAIYYLTKNGEFSRSWGLRDQIQRASVSVMSNIAEGFERYSTQEFKHFLSISRGSCAEVRSQIQLAKSLGYITDAECTIIYQKCIALSRAIGALRLALEKNTTK